MKPRNYQCRKCGKINQITTPWGMLFIPHLGWHKWLKCECGARRHFQRRVFQPEMDLRQALKMEYQIVAAHEETIETLLNSRNATQDKLDEARRELDEADSYYCSMMDNLRDDIRELKQKLTNAEVETAKKIFADLYTAADASYDKHTVWRSQIDEFAKKYKVED